MDAKQRTVAWLLGFILMVPGLACRSTRTDPDDYLTSPEAMTCFKASEARSFSPLHERFIYVRVKSDQHYLLTMDRMCMNLPFATGITISGEYHRICSDTRATITFNNLGNTNICAIVAVEAVRDREEAEALVKKRTTPPPPRR